MRRETRSKLLSSFGKRLRLNGLLKSNRVSLYRGETRRLGLLYPILLERFTFVRSKRIYLFIIRWIGRLFSQTFPPLNLIILGESRDRTREARWLATMGPRGLLLVKSGSIPLRRIFAGGEYVTSLYAISTMGRDLEKKMERNEKRESQARRAISSIFPEWKVENSFPARVEAIKSTITGRMIRLLITVSSSCHL